MVIEAAYADGTGAANALHMSQAQWEELQRAYCVGDLLMPCCNAPAIPKVSANCYDPCGSPWMMEDTGGVRASAGRGRSIL